MLHISAMTTLTMAPAFYEVHHAPLLDEVITSPEVKRQVKAADWQTFIVAMTVLIGGGYMLVSGTVSPDVKLAVAGFIGAVITYFFGRQISNSSAAATITASQLGATQSAQQANGGKS